MPGEDERVGDPYWAALLNAPPLAYGLAEMGRLVRTGQLRGSYSDAERELVDVTMSVDLGYNAILALHIPDALAVGVRIEAIDALRAGRDSELTEAERAIVLYTRGMITGRSDDALYQGMVGRLSPRGALEFTVFIVFLLATMRLWQGLGVPDSTDAEIDAILDGYRTGLTALPDPKARIG